MLELGIVPIRFVLMKKRMQFLHYILNESDESMIKRVYITLKEDSRKGDLIYQTKSGKIVLDIDLSDEEIQVVSKGAWKNFLDNKN